MASIRLQRDGAESGSLPPVCLCCGRPASRKVMHTFYYDPLWLMLLPVGKVVRYIYASQNAVLRVPVCDRHRWRLKLPTWIGYAFAVSLFPIGPIMVLMHVGQMEALFNATAVGLFIYVPAMLVLLLVLRLISPRCVELDYRVIKLACVSPQFVEAFGQRQLPPGARAPQSKQALVRGLAIGGGVAVAALAGMCMFGLLVKAIVRKPKRDLASEARAIHAKALAEADAEFEALRKKSVQPRYSPPPGSRVTSSSTKVEIKSRVPFESPSESVSAPTPEAQAATVVTGDEYKLKGSERYPPATRPIVNATELQPGMEVWAPRGMNWYRCLVLGPGPGRQVLIRYPSAAGSSERPMSLVMLRLPVQQVESTAQKSAAADPAPKSDPAQPLTPRTWSDATGKFSVEATFVGLKDGVVTLRRSDNREVTLPLDKLSPDDQKIARQLAVE